MKLIGLLALAATLGAQSFDGNGAQEAFYVQPKHRWYASKRFWVPTVVFVGSGVLTGVLASRSGHPLTVRPIMPAPVPTPTFGGVNFIGIGGPGVPVVVVKK